MAVIPTTEDLGRRVADVGGLAGTVSGRAFGQAPAGMLVDIGQQQARDDDETAVFAARTKLNEWERTNVHDAKTGAVNRLGQDALSVPQDLQRSFDETRSDISKTLTSERQRQAFDALAEARRAQVLEWGNRHAITQRNIYETGLYEADLKSSIDRASAYANDLPKAAAEMTVAGERIVAWGKSRGWSVEQTQEALRKQANDMHTAVLDTILATDDWQRAEKYLNANSSQMDPRTVLRLSTALRKQADVVEGTRAAQEVVGKVRFQPNDLDRVMAITMQSESGGRRYGLDGNLLESPKGAKGEMQVLDATNYNPGFGVKPAANDTPEERARVGRDYLGAMIKRYGGDMQKAWAAYNAGPGAVDKAMTEAVADAGQFRSGDGPSDYWLQKMPRETQAYVARNMKALESGAGAPPRASLQDIHNEIRSSMAGQRPERIKVALDESTRLYREAQDEIKINEDNATTEAMRGLMANGGSWAALPPRVRNAVPPKEVDNLMTFGENISKNRVKTNPAVYLKLTDDQFLRGLSDAEFFKLQTQLSQSDWQHFAQQRMKPLNGNSPGELNTAAINETVKNRLTAMGIDPTPKDGSKDAERVAAIQRYVRDSLFSAQAVTGKKFDDAQTQSHIDGLFAKTTLLKDTFLGWETGTKSGQMVGMKVKDIPGDVRRALEDDFKRRGIEPTDADILGAYWRAKDAMKISAARTGGW